MVKIIMKKIFIIFGMCIMFILSMTLSYAALTDNLEAYYDYDTNNSFLDLTVNNNDGTLELFPLDHQFTSDGLIENAYYFDGDDDYISLPTTLIKDWSTFSFSIWIYFISQDGGGADFISNRNGGDYSYYFDVRSDENLYSFLRTDAGSSVQQSVMAGFTLNAWHHIVSTYDGSTHRVYVDGVLEDVNTAVEGDVANVGGLMVLGMEGDQSNRDFEGRMDETAFWDGKVLTDGGKTEGQTAEGEIAELYNLGSGLAYPFSSDPVLETILLDDDNNTISDIDEHDKFFIGTNYTLDNVFIPGGVCNFTTTNISASFESDNLSNVTLSTSTDQLELIINEGVANLTDDEYFFGLCRVQVKADVQILVNNVLHNTINKNIIPLCNIGILNFDNVTTDFITNTSLNMTIKCPTCDGINTEILLVRTGNLHHDVINWHRNFESHSEDLVEYPGLELYAYFNHGYHFDEGSHNITTSCNDTFDTTQFSISNVNLSIDILQINDVVFTSGMVIEATDNYDIVINVYGDQISFLQFNTSLEDGTLLQTTDTFNLDLDHLSFNDTGIINISIVGLDDELNPTSVKDYFIVNDTVNPNMIWSYPLNDNSTEILLNTTVVIDLDFDDINLFAYEVLVYDPSSALIYNWSDTSLTVSSYNLLEAAIFTSLGNYTINATVSDDHTIKTIPEYNFDVNDSSKKLTFPFEKIDRYERFAVPITIEYVGVREVVDVTLTKLTDRYEFDYVFDSRITPIFNDKYIISCPNIVFRHNSPYIAHFVCPESRNWIDFESDNVDRFFVRQLSNDSYEVELELFDDELRSITFNSIGGINTVSEVVTFEVVSSFLDYTFFANFDKDNLAHVMLLGLLLVLFIGSYILYRTYNSIAWGLLGFTAGLTVGSVFFMINPWLGGITWVVAFFLMIK